jgi:hypothetical protein
MRTFKYSVPSENDDVKEIILTEEDILKEYWEFWSRKMTEKYGLDHEWITEKNCIEDWIAGHWALEITKNDT